LGAALSTVERKLYEAVSGEALRRIQHAGGKAAKATANEVTSRALGADRAMSGFKRGRVRLNAGYDLTSRAGVDVNLSPAGAWRLAQDGRRGVAGPMRPIVPKRRSGAKALRTPWGPRASVRASRSRGLGVVDDTVEKSSREVPKAAFDQLRSELGRQFRG
jgi:hypothetical protein